MLRELAPELAATAGRCSTPAAAGDRDPDRRPRARHHPVRRDRGPRHRRPQRARLAELADTLQFDDPINIQFTSGTTGAPKGATLTHHNILNNGFFIGEAQKLGPEDKVCIPVPLYHCFGMVLGNLACITHGSRHGLSRRRLRPAGRAARPCTRSAAPPSTACRPCSSPSSATPSSPSFDLSSLRTGIMAGSPCPIEVMRRVVAEMHMGEVTIAYGMTETSPVSFQSSHRRPARPPRLDRRPHPPASRGQARRRRRPHRAARRCPASCAPAATR